MTDIVLTAQNPFRLTVDGTVATDGSGEVIANLTPAAIAGEAGALLAVNDLSDVASAATARTNLGATIVGEDLFTATDAATALGVLGGDTAGIAVFQSETAADARTALGTNLERFVVQCFVAVTTAGAVYITVPTGYSGTVTLVQAVANGDPNGTAAFTTAIGPSSGPFTPITDGNFSFGMATSAGEVTTATPTAANVVTGGTSVLEVAWDNGAAQAFVVTVTMIVTRT